GDGRRCKRRSMGAIGRPASGAIARTVPCCRSRDACSAPSATAISSWSRCGRGTPDPRRTSALLFLAARAGRVEVAGGGVVGDADRTARIAELVDEGPGRAARERRLVDGRADPVPVGGDRAFGNVQVGAETLVGAVADGAALAADAAQDVLAVR